jgi:serine/threonine protein kinase
MVSRAGDPGAESGRTYRGFTLLNKIGEGNTAEVYRARNNTFGGLVALKRWRNQPTEDQRRKFLEECQLQWRLSGHANIVRLHWAEASPGQRPWLATELYEMSLADRLHLYPPPAVDEAYAIADDILAGLTAIHHEGHLHRDVKPANVLLKGGRAALGDLGIAMPATGVTVDAAAGTEFFLAPELMRGEVPSYRSDVYSAAVTIRTMMPDLLSSAVEALLTGALSFRPADRPVDALDFRRRLRDARRSSPAVPMPPTTSISFSVLPLHQVDPSLMAST